MMNMQVLKLSEKVTLQDTPVLRQTKEAQCDIKYLMHQNAVVTGLFFITAISDLLQTMKLLKHLPLLQQIFHIFNMKFKDTRAC